VQPVVPLNLWDSQPELANNQDGSVAVVPMTTRQAYARADSGRGSTLLKAKENCRGIASLAVFFQRPGGDWQSNFAAFLVSANN